MYPMEPFQLQVTQWSRFIDDIVFIWSGSREECLDFIAKLNTNPYNIFLTANISETSVDFLDLTLSLQNNRIVTNLHRKQTATNSLLHFSSFHPTHLKKGIPVGQFLRLRRNCTEHRDFKKNAKELTTRFHNRGYPKHIVTQAYQRAQESNREELLRSKVRKEDNTPRFITSFNNQWGDLKSILNKHWGILLTDSRLATLLPAKPVLTARRAPNLRDRLTRSHFERKRMRLGHGTRLQGSYALWGL